MGVCERERARSTEREGKEEAANSKPPYPACSFEERVLETAAWRLRKDDRVVVCCMCCWSVYCVCVT